jgi:hypothetical protein
MCLKKHLASHLEQLALFALPTLAEDEVGLEAEPSAALSESDAMSLVRNDSDASETSDYDATEDGEIHGLSEAMNEITRMTTSTPILTAGDEVPAASQEPFKTNDKSSESTLP